MVNKLQVIVKSVQVVDTIAAPSTETHISPMGYPQSYYGKKYYILDRFGERK